LFVVEAGSRCWGDSRSPRQERQKSFAGPDGEQEVAQRPFAEAVLMKLRQMAARRSRATSPKNGCADSSCGMREAASCLAADGEVTSAAMSQAAPRRSNGFRAWIGQ
jgi:hypothetical protein